MTTQEKVNNYIAKIKNLLDSGNLDEAFDLLDEVFDINNANYSDFSKEYAQPSDNFNIERFRSRLKRFVVNSSDDIKSHFEIVEEDLIEGQVNQDMKYDFTILYELNFT